MWVVNRVSGESFLSVSVASAVEFRFHPPAVSFLAVNFRVGNKFTSVRLSQGPCNFLYSSKFRPRWLSQGPCNFLYSSKFRFRFAARWLTRLARSGFARWVISL